MAAVSTTETPKSTPVQLGSAAEAAGLATTITRRRQQAGSGYSLETTLTTQAGKAGQTAGRNGIRRRRPDVLPQGWGAPTSDVSSSVA